MRPRIIEQIRNLALPVAILVFLSACSGGSGGVAAVVGATGNGAGSTQPPIDLAEAAINICGRSSIEADECDTSVPSTAPLDDGQTSAPTAAPGANGTADCSYAGIDSGAADDIAITVFLPPYAATDTFPLILHSHGWGGSRVSTSTSFQPADFDNTFNGIAARVRNLRDAGYIVISFDQRGWGASNGQALVIHPCFEAVDAQNIVNWALTNLPVDTSDGDIVVGSVGGSYGGAYQMMLAAMDDRIDAITPVATWNRLATPVNHLEGVTALDASSVGFHAALITNEVVKRGYVNGLCVLGTTAGARLDSVVTEACGTVQQEGAQNGLQMDDAATGNPEMRKLFANNGMSNLALRNGRAAMDVDVLLFQGMRDMVFDGNEAYDNYVFFSDPANNTGDVRLITTDGGHMLTTMELAQAQYAQTQPIKAHDGKYQIQGLNKCANVDMFEAIFDWFDQKLKARPATVQIPDLCIALDGYRGATAGVPEAQLVTRGVTALSSVPVGNTAGTYAIGSAANPVAVNTTVATNLEVVGSPRFFLSLGKMTEAGYLAGIPVLTEVVIESQSTPKIDVTGFLAIGIQKADGAFIEVDEQITAIRRSNSVLDPAVSYSNLRMPMIGESLEKDDEIGVLLYQRHAQYLLTASQGSEYGSNAYTIHGTISIPVFNSLNSPIRPTLPTEPEN